MYAKHGHDGETLLARIIALVGDDTLTLTDAGRAALEKK
jgi:hypothetical protein